jgi:fatty-acyl-CoA synthase
VRDGWYWTGDLFHRDRDGWFRFAGRSEDWLRVDSENLAVADIENLLARWPDARAVAVYAVPDPVAGDQVMAAVQLRDGVRPDAGSLERFLREQPDLGSKMPPRFVRFLDELPVTATLKTARARLRADGWEVPEPVLWRPYGSRQPAVYRPLTGTDRTEVRALFAEHGRGITGLTAPAAG